MTNKSTLQLFVLFAFFTFTFSTFGQEFLQHRTNFKITDWKFHKGDAHAADAASEAIGDAWTPVTVPHTWNAKDVFTKGSDYYQGFGWYRSTLTIEQTQQES
jgi:hypothetical protein